jgi:DNA-binding HxlR family transcriptional regulator
MPAQELCALLQWEKSWLSHQVRRMQEQGLIVREPNPADAQAAARRLARALREASAGGRVAAPQSVMSRLTRSVPGCGRPG